MDEIIPEQNTRNNIILAAYDLFLQQGFHGTSMRQIALRAGISLSGLYNHFKNGKDEIFEAVFWQYHPYHEVIPILLETQGDSIEERVQRAAEKMVQAINKRQDFLNLMFIEVVEFRSIHAQNLLQMILPQMMLVAEHITGGQSELLRDIPPLMLIRSFLGLFFSYYITEIIFSGINPDEFHINAMKYLVDIYLHGIMNDNRLTE
jgi:AcrR family transcriptional regulator